MTVTRQPTLAERHARRHRPDGHGRDRLDRRLGRCRHAARAGRRSTASRICSSTWRSRAPKRRSALDIADEIEAVGGHLNAYTSREHTAYYAKVLKDDVALAVDILADILQHSTFDAAELERERTVILQEIGQANDTPDDIIFDLFQERAFPDQPMGRPVLGPRRDHHAISIARRVAGYHAAHTTPRRACCWSPPAMSP